MNSYQRAILTSLMSLSFLTFGRCSLFSAATGDQNSGVPRLARPFIANVCFDGKRLLTVTTIGPSSYETHDRAAMLYDVESGRELQRFPNHIEAVRSVYLMSDGQHILTGCGAAEDMGIISKDASIRLWDIQSAAQVRQFIGHSGMVYALDVSFDGTRLLSVGGGMKAIVWDVNTGQQLFDLHDIYTPGQPPAVAFSPDGLRIVGFETKGTRPPVNRIKVWDGISGKELLSIDPDNSQFQWVEFSPDGKWIATASGSGVARLWDAQTGRQRQSFVGHTAYVHQASFSADSQHLLTISSDQSARLWDLMSGEQIGRYDHPGEVSQARLSHDGKRLLTKWSMRVTGKTVNGASLWDLDSGKELHQWTENVDGLVGFAPRDNRILFIKDAKPYRIYDGATGVLSREYK